MAGCDAGGRLLMEISESVGKVLGEWGSEGLGADPGRRVKGEVLDVMLGGEWRRGLGCAMEVAERLLDEVRNGFMRVYDYVVDFRMELSGPGLVGTGSGLLNVIFEVGLEFDWLLGLPYYPGSTLKGAARAVAEEILGKRAADALFGKPGEGGWMGLYTFAPSYPVGCISGKPCLVVTGDVVTPHYYVPGRGIVESELEARPTPIQHVSIAPGTVFRFIVGVRLPRGMDRGEVEEALRVAASDRGMKILESPSLTSLGLARLALRLLGTSLMSGFAARASKGYNVFTPITEEGGEAIDRRVVSFKVVRGGRSGGS